MYRLFSHAHPLRTARSRKCCSHLWQKRHDLSLQMGGKCVIRPLGESRILTHSCRSTHTHTHTHVGEIISCVRTRAPIDMCTLRFAEHGS
jgi:hypothetical protein